LRTKGRTSLSQCRPPRGRGRAYRILPLYSCALARVRSSLTSRRVQINIGSALRRACARVRRLGAYRALAFMARPNSRCTAAW
jgi:hypothetical protein